MYGEVAAARIRPGDTVLDCGANVGVYTKYALERGAAEVIAIEPAPETISCLRRTFAADIAAGSVVVYPKGVWNRDELLQLKTNPTRSSMANSVVIGGDTGGPAVPLTTIDKLVSELRLAHVDVIKMDIEGAEKKALEGASETLRRFRPRLAVALEHNRDDAYNIPAMVAARWPAYKIACGACRNIDYLRPDILFAW
jgi:FkbM family methyltransferase